MYARFTEKCIISKFLFIIFVGNRFGRLICFIALKQLDRTNSIRVKRLRLDYGRTDGHGETIIRVPLKTSDPLKRALNPCG